MRKIVLIYNTVIVTILTIVGFLDATTPPKLMSGILFFPLAAYFWRMIVPRTQHAIPQTLPAVVEPSKAVKKKSLHKKETPIKLTPIKETPKGAFDANRRMFLRLIGSAGVSVFLLSIFSGKAEAAFFGSTPGPGTVGIKDTSGILINPSEKQPTDGYNITEVDDAIPSYYGYVDKNGAWYIVKEDSSGAYRYAKGSSSFSANWTNRAGLAYDYFDSVF
ncbi:hypothetical protein A3I56_01725 [Candidatus Roizmanbacteria bacterium RIFCSPLOWO2_02_FULL_43_10]|uniref:Uncharacterized protein n=2 Tax=Candidatus Roizmaniibacteriota TaxID=1752723 RepID=A0A1F7JTY8_9BACT|nr:MAG: hypothetical protein A3F32_01870 [Candidatus Roizmanbacteria bacterium RIFCSPHIGHO2_12_FULL_42_10]OGK59058.1 MAG: hypothetical protein A3I56_01725 [Candidatus Roizmanbacteria bacterium RIFCSPLOWO2_02_FULL_43_10]